MSLGVNAYPLEEDAESKNEAHREYVNGEYEEPYGVHLAEDVPTDMADTNAFRMDGGG
ncbi:MAG: hypothetical protein M1831_002035 [Alyxoria varia]|nr:MAG: hypothetical protein M1831_002035 [Alyxoria varia]